MLNINQKISNLFNKKSSKSKKGSGEAVVVDIVKEEILRAIAGATSQGDGKGINETLVNEAISILEKSKDKKAREKKFSIISKILSNEKAYAEFLALSRWYIENGGSLDDRLRVSIGRMELNLGNPQKAVTFLRKAPFNKSNAMSLFHSQRLLFDYGGTKKTAAKMMKTFDEDENLPTEATMERLYGSTSFLQRSGELYLSVEQPKNPKGVVIFSSYHCESTIGLNLLSILRLKEQGYAAIHLSEGMLPPQPTGIKEIDELHGIIHYQKNKIRGEGKNPYLEYDWNIDWENQKVEALGINFYQCIFERLARDLHKYRIKLEGKTKDYFDSLLYQADVALRVAVKIEENIAKGLKIPVRFFSGTSQYLPYGIFRIYCMERGKKCNMEFISVMTAEEHNFYNKINELSRFIALRNLTAYSDLRKPQMAPVNAIKQWVQNNPITKKEEEFVNTFVNYDRNLTGKIHEEGKKIIEKLKAFKKEGRNIVCVFGKVIWDFDYPYNHGPAHGDLEDWIKHTVSAAGKSNAIFLIKPHPHEIMPALVGAPSERFIDLLPEDIPENVIVLDNDWLNTRDLYQYIDLGIVWAGTVALDLGVNNIPVLACCDWGTKDYPVGFPMPKDRHDYEAILCNPKDVKMPDNYPERCKDVLRYMNSDELFIPYGYYRRSTTNKFFIPEWFEDELEHFFKNGDPYVEQTARRFFEDRPEHPA